MTVPILDFGDRERAAAILYGIDLVCMDQRPMDVVTALHHVFCHTIAEISPDLPAALANVDRLAEDMKDFLRKRMGN